MGRSFWICLGGAIGTGARYLVATWIAQAFGSDFPRGTILVNVSGSFLIAALMELSLSAGVISPGVRMFLTTGVMGGYTTYSSFNYETLRLVEERAIGLALPNLGLTVVGCLAASVLGLFAARVLSRANLRPVSIAGVKFQRTTEAKRRSCAACQDCPTGGDEEDSTPGMASSPGVLLISELISVVRARCAARGACGAPQPSGLGR